MPLFEFEAGQLVPAQFGHPVDEPLEPEVLDAVRDQVLEAIQRPLFPVSWTQNEGDSRRLVAMDAAGKAVSVEVVERLDAVTLVSALSRAGRTSELGWLQVAELYPRGVPAFRRDWNAFREAIPASMPPAPRLVIVAARVEDEVRPALEVLGESGVAVHEIAVRQMSNGRVFLSIDELRPHAITTVDRVLTARAASRRELPPVLAEAVPGIETAMTPVSPATTMSISSASPGATDGELDWGPERAARGQDEQEATEEQHTADEQRTNGEQQTDGQQQTTDQHRPLGTLPKPTPAAPADGAPGETARAEVVGGSLRGRAPAAHISQPDGGEPTAERDLRVIAESLGEDTPVVWIQHRRGISHEAVLTTRGTLRLLGGSEHSDPSAAARGASGREVDGWRVWRFGESGPSLADAWDEIQRVGDRGGHGRRRR